MRFAIPRWILAALCVGASVKLMLDAFRINSIGAAGHLVFSFVSLISAVLLIAPETVFRLAEWCSRPFTNILFPSERLSKPPLSYKLARHYAGSLRLADAAVEYERILYFYPDEREAYLELLSVAKRMQDRDLFDTYASRFEKHFHRAPEVTFDSPPPDV